MRKPVAYKRRNLQPGPETTQTEAMSEKIIFIAKDFFVLTQKSAICEYFGARFRTWENKRPA